VLSKFRRWGHLWADAKTDHISGRIVKPILSLLFRIRRYFFPCRAAAESVPTSADQPQPLSYCTFPLSPPFSPIPAPFPPLLRTLTTAFRVIHQNLNSIHQPPDLSPPPHASQLPRNPRNPSPPPVPWPRPRSRCRRTPQIREDGRSDLGYECGGEGGILP
jgi:hypothetical protein